MIRRRSLVAGAALYAARLPSHRAQATETLDVVLDWLPNANHAALFAAQHSRAFQDAGLTVNLIAPADPDSPARLVAAGQADVAISYGTQINLLDAAGLDLVRFATLIDRPLNSVMAVKGRGVATLADLRGKKVGISVAGVEDALLGAMLQTAGLTLDDITPVRVNYNMVAALMSRRLDAGIGAFRNAEVLQVRQLGETPLVFPPEDHGVPLYDELILVARRARREDPRLRRFMAALQAGTAALLRMPDAFWQAFAEAHPEIATPLSREGWIATMPAIAANPARLDGRRYLSFQAFALAHGIVTSSLPLDRFAAQLPA